MFSQVMIPRGNSTARQAVAQWPGSHGTHGVPPPPPPGPFREKRTRAQGLAFLVKQHSSAGTVTWDGCAPKCMTGERGAYMKGRQYVFSDGLSKPKPPMHHPQKALEFLLIYGLILQNFKHPLCTRERVGDTQAVSLA